MVTKLDPPRAVVARRRDIVEELTTRGVRCKVTSGRGWTAERFRDWLADAWIRLLLDPACLRGPPEECA